MRKPQPGAEAPRGAPSCPFCASHDAEVISLFGTQAMTLQYRCRACGSLYEAIKYDQAEEVPGPPRSPRRRGGAAS
ncbi:MAG TPA: hypothetical protein VIP52_00005 [Candidatus Dormibacteraeota bacterium]